MVHVSSKARLYSLRLSFTAFARLTLALLSTLLLSEHGKAQEPSSASLHGTVHGEDGKPVAQAEVQLLRKGSSDRRTSPTDVQGSYSFTKVQDGIYTLQAMKATKDGGAVAYLDLVTLKPHESKTIDLTLEPLQPSKVAAVTPQFFDEPQFTVAGVTDTTSLGGHGSDTVVRTRDSIAKDTVSLGKPAASGPANSAAEISLRAAVESHPDSVKANHDLGRFLMEAGMAHDAIPYLEHASEASPSEYQTSYDLARAYASAGEYQRAREKAQGLLAHNDRAELHHLLGDIDEHFGDSLEAVLQYQRAAELDPSDSYLFDWGSELLLHHAPEPALEVFTKGNRLFPRSARMLIGLGAAWFAHGSYEQAVQAICQASDLTPNDPVPYLFLGKIQRAQGTPSEELVEKLHRFATLQPENAEANYYYAVVLQKQRRDSHDKALRSQIESLLNNAVRLNPRFAPASLQLGILHAEEGEYAAAVADYQRALQADAQTEEAHYRLAQAYRQLGQSDKAKEELRIYEQLTKESAQRLDRERHEIRQFVYTLRDQPTQPVP